MMSLFLLDQIILSNEDNSFGKATMIPQKAQILNEQLGLMISIAAPFLNAIETPTICRLLMNLDCKEAHIQYHRIIMWSKLL
jgi:hypothetical protein